MPRQLLAMMRSRQRHGAIQFGEQGIEGLASFASHGIQAVPDVQQNLFSVMKRARRVSGIVIAESLFGHVDEVERDLEVRFDQFCQNAV
jgi:hypothetical protein